MKQNVIFKASGDGFIYKVIESPKKSVFGGKMFRIIEGRKWLGGTDFFNLDMAICAACNLAAPSGVLLRVVSES